MTKRKAIVILEYHQRWRRGEYDDMICTPAELTKAMDIVIKAAKRKCKGGGSNDTTTIRT